MYANDGIYEYVMEAMCIYSVYNTVYVFPELSKPAARARLDAFVGNESPYLLKAIADQ